MAKKPWKEVTLEERLKMKKFVEQADPDTPLPPEYVASYLDSSPATLQKKRCEDTNGIPFIKIGKRAVAYIKRDVVSHIQANQYTSTSQYA